MQHIIDIEPASAASYPVFCGSGAADKLAELWRPEWKQAALIGDTTTLGLFGHGLQTALETMGVQVLALSFDPGEGQKTRATKARLEDAMLAAGFDRSSCVVAVGGGIPLDIAGFVAATYMRGIAHINVATTLLAQVDAAVGGKTAVNANTGKNLIGAFHHPCAVLIDTAALEKLPAGEIENGLAEAVKHAVLADAALFARLEQWAPQREAKPPPDEIIARCIQIKAEVVAADDRDTGKRHILNFGHTVGHAIEHATKHATPHGHAVAIGMVIEARLATEAGWLAPDVGARMEVLLGALGLPTTPPCEFAHAAPGFRHDKKTTAGVVYCALPTGLGVTEAHGDGPGGWSRATSLDQIARAWTADTDPETVRVTEG
jgi:3-dehydroquinate synthase